MILWKHNIQNNNCIRIGVPGYETIQPLDITIDNLQLYNRFLEEDEINSLLYYNNNSSLPEGLIGLWNFEENSLSQNYLVNEIGKSIF